MLFILSGLANVVESGLLCLCERLRHSLQEGAAAALNQPDLLSVLGPLDAGAIQVFKPEVPDHAALNQEGLSEAEQRMAGSSIADDNTGKQLAKVGNPSLSATLQTFLDSCTTDCITPWVEQSRSTQFNTVTSLKSSPGAYRLWCMGPT